MPISGHCSTVTKMSNCGVLLPPLSNEHPVPFSIYIFGLWYTKDFPACLQTKQRYLLVSKEISWLKRILRVVTSSRRLFALLWRYVRLSRLPHSSCADACLPRPPAPPRFFSGIIYHFLVTLPHFQSDQHISFFLSHYLLSKAAGFLSCLHSELVSECLATGGCLVFKERVSGTDVSKDFKSIQGANKKM